MSEISNILRMYIMNHDNKREGGNLWTDDEIIKNLIEHPEKGLEILMNTYIGLVYTIVYSKISCTCQKEDIEECTSDIFYEIYKTRSLINLEKGSIKSYLSVIAKRKAIDMFRKSKNEYNKNISIDDMDYDSIAAKDTNIDTVAIDNETRNILIKEIRALGEPDSEIIIRKYYFGQSTKLIAKDLKLKENTVDKKVSRGLQKLKQSLGGVL